MPLGANVPRRRPSADASSLILPPRTFAPAFGLARRPTSEKQGARLFRQACDPTRGAACRPSGRNKGGGDGRRPTPEDIRPEGLQVASGRSGRGELFDRTIPLPGIGEDPRKRNGDPKAAVTCFRSYVSTPVHAD